MNTSNRSTMTWPEAVGELAAQRTRSETYVGLLKKYGDDEQIARGQLTYADLKADFDAVIAGLLAALSTGQPPESLSSLQTKLTGGASGLVEFGDVIRNLLPKTAGQKGVLDNIAKMIPIETLLNKLSDAVSALYSNHRNDDVQRRKTIQTQLEAARWPTFSEIKAAQ
jgi:hypothetical protein